MISASSPGASCWIIRPNTCRSVSRRSFAAMQEKTASAAFGRRRSTLSGHSPRGLGSRSLIICIKTHVARVWWCGRKTGGFLQRCIGILESGATCQSRRRNGSGASEPEDWRTRRRESFGQGGGRVRLSRSAPGCFRQVRLDVPTSRYLFGKVLTLSLLFS